MGIPRFYRWLSERYPRINQRIEENVELLPQFDNMYLDANGIIHTCSHPNDEDTTSARLTMDEMVLNMMGYIDRMVQIIRPQKVLFVAVDGCAPRAKMNQQRSRRFASARDSAISIKRAIEAGEITEEEADKMFDSNVITPGTPFMAELSVHFEFFLRKKIREDASWSHLEIIYSGHEVPGEGEHKIMEYIRRTRTEPGYDPNTRHCLCGLDADLMMLGLATHEPHFSLLREEVDFSSFSSRQKKNATKEVKKQISKDKWELLRISTLREYMNLEYAPVKAKFPGMNFERVVDDWVMMVMLVGNDFLPYIPTMDIFEGALDNLIEIHKEMLPIWKGHLTSDDGKLNWERIEGLFKRIGQTEEAVFKRREEERQEQERKLRKNQGQIFIDDNNGDLDEDDDLLNDADEALLDENDDLFSAQHKAQQRRRKNAYYFEKFGIPFDDANGDADLKIRDIVKRYVEGLDWVFNYYYQGVPSWIWFYPFHFAPLASDVKDLVALAKEVRHELGEPFKPFSQLLGCLPASSAHCLPLSYQRLMRDPTSPLKDFYPTEWEVDQNGKRNPWEFVNLLPFIDERKLAEAVKKIPLNELTEEEKSRNQFGVPFVYKKDLSVTTRLQSSLKALPSLDASLTSKNVFAYSPHALRTPHNPNLLSGYQLIPGDSALSVHPDLSHTASGLFMAKLNTFGSQSRKATFVLRFSQETVPKTVNEIKSFVDSLPESVWINYPHLHEALVSQVIDVFGNHYDATSKTWREMSSQEKREFDREAVNASTKALCGDKLVGTGGIELDRIYFMMRVRPLNGMKEDAESGLLKRSFAAVEDETWIPHHLILFENPLIDARFVDAPALPLNVRFPLETKVICVAEKGYGMLGTIVEHDESNKQVAIRFPSRAQKQNEFGHLVASTILDTYTGLSKIAHHLNLHPFVVDKFLGSLKVSGIAPRERGKPVFVDFGLNLRVGRTHVIPGYARSKAPEAVGAAWSTGEAVVRVIGSTKAENYDNTRNLASDSFEYTERAVELLARYRAKFPRLFEKVSRKPNEHEFDKSDLFNTNDAPDEADRIMTWLRQIPTYGIPLVPISSKYMSREAVVAVQKGADEHVKAEMLAPPPPEVKVMLPPHVIVKPPTASRGWVESPTVTIPPSLGDRICNLGTASIPFGLKGTVVATHPSTAAVQVVFDVQFVGGSSLSGLCRPGYGALLPCSHVLNLSRKAPVPLEGPIRKVATPVSTTKPLGSTSTPAGRPQRQATPIKAVTPTPQPSTAAGVARTIVTPTTATPIVARSVAPPAPEPPAVSNDEDVDDLARYFKQLMASKAAASVTAASSTPGISSGSGVSTTTATTPASSASSSSTKKPAQKSTTTPNKPASAAKSSSNTAAKTSTSPTTSGSKKRPAAHASATPSPAAAPITIAVQPPPTSPSTAPAVQPQVQVGPASPAMGGMHPTATMQAPPPSVHPGMMMMMQPPHQPIGAPPHMMMPAMMGYPPSFPMHAPPHSIPVYLAPNTAPPPTIPIHVAPNTTPLHGAGVDDMAARPKAASGSATALLDKMFERAHKTENRVFEKKQ